MGPREILERSLRQDFVGLKGWLFGEAAALGAAATGLRRGRAPRVIGAAGRTAGRAEAAAAGRATLRLVDLGRCVLQRRADLVDVQLYDRALLTLAGLE